MEGTMGVARGIAAGIAALLLAAGCAGGDVVSDEDVAAEAVAETIDAPDVVATDKAEEVADTAPDEATPTCLTSLLDWQCLPSAGKTCGASEECDGAGTCAEPPCWGLCQDFPGQCLPALAGKTCLAAADCGQGFGCAGRLGGAPGFCRARPFDGACWADGDCGAGAYCAGEALCVPGTLCPGGEQAGKCVTKPATGACFEDADCTAGWCEGAKLCVPGAAGCAAEQAGACKAGARPGCFDQKGCADSPDGTLCTGAFQCQEAGECPVPDQPGFCAKFGGFGSCWEDSDCTDGQFCHSALACRPGTLCHAAFAHAGTCAEAPAAGEGLTFVIAPATAGKDFAVLAMNRGAVAVFLDPCATCLLGGKVVGTDKWPDNPFDTIMAGPFGSPACSGPGPFPWMTVPPGGAWVSVANAPLAGTLRVVVPYRLGCAQGEVDDECGAELVALSQPFEVK
jgi:hypothetical protein